MKLLTLALTVGVLAAAMAAWRLGGAVGAGALFGALSGLGLGAGAIAWQRHLLRTRPERAMTVFVLAFLAKLVFVTATAMILRFGEVQLVDWTAFLVAFPIAVVWTTCTGWIGAFQPASHPKQSGAH